MKRLFILSAIVFSLYACNESDSKASLSTGVMTEEQKAGALSDTASFTSIQWLDSTYQDLGKVKKGQVVEISWRLKNTGNKPLIIQNVRPGCGCTVADKPEEPIAPGRESVIKGKFDSDKQSEGEHRKMIAVVANTSGSTNHQLNFRVEVVK